MKNGAISTLNFGKKACFINGKEVANVKINIDIDAKHKDTCVTIQANEWSNELKAIVDYLQDKEAAPARLFAVDNEQTILLHPQKIDYIYAANRKIFAAIGDKRFEIRMKLYEAEKTLKHAHFMRFSKSVIGNVLRIAYFELHFNGNLCVYFQSGNKEYVNHKYVKAIKRKLMMGGEKNVD